MYETVMSQKTFDTERSLCKGNKRFLILNTFLVLLGGGIRNQQVQQ
jgi:hypothetical protein